MSRRAVITGIGIVAPNGIGTDAYWKATTAGSGGIRRISRFDPSKYATQLAGEVEAFNPRDYIEQRLIVQTDRWTQMALAATQMALQDAGLDPAQVEPYQMSVITASSSGGNEFGQKEIQNLWGKGPNYVGAYQSIAWFYAATTGQISIKHGLKGPCGVVISEGAGGLEALQHSRRTVRRGVDAVVSGDHDVFDPGAPAAAGSTGLRADCDCIRVRELRNSSLRSADPCGSPPPRRFISPPHAAARAVSYPKKHDRHRTGYRPRSRARRPRLLNLDTRTFFPSHPVASLLGHGAFIR